MSLLHLLDDSDQFFSPQLARMLDATLMQDGGKDAALRGWAAQVDFDAIKHADFRLIPSLYARAGTHPALAEYHGRMKGIYRYYFYRNTRFLSFVDRIFGALNSAGIDFIVFKGTAITLQYTESAALRFSADCDVLIHRQDKQRAEALLEGCGLSITYDETRRKHDRHSHDFVDAENNGLDLHWYALHECCWPGADSGFWERSRIIIWKGHKVRVLAPEDELLVAGMNGTKELVDARAEWICDADRILKANSALNWKLLHQELQCRKMVPRFLGALGMMCRFIPTFPESEAERAFAPEIKRAIEKLVIENRTFDLDQEIDREVTKTLTGERASLTRSNSVVRHMRYTSHADGSVAHLYLHADLRKYIKYCFVIVDARALSLTPNCAARMDEIHMILPEGVLRVPTVLNHRAPRLRLKAQIKMLHFSDSSQGSLTLKLKLKNLSFRPWIVHHGSDGQFSLSYHLYSKGWNVLNWVHPPARFLVARLNQVALILPRATLDLELEVTRPHSPGKYIVRPDIQQGADRWLDPYKRGFPAIRVYVAG